MKKLIFLIFVLALASCTAAPTQAPVQPVAQEPVVVTVVVQPTQAPQQQEPIVVTVVVPATPVPEQPTAVPPPTQAPAAAPTVETIGGAIVLDDLLGKGVFNSITLSGNEFTLRCVTRELTISATASLIDIDEAELFYRVRDYPQALYDSPWRSAGKMEEVSSGVFSMLLTGEMVNPDARLDPGWFEFQIVGLNKGGGVVDRTQKIEQLVVYRINCP
jgi:hypothetical protein